MLMSGNSIFEALPYLLTIIGALWVVIPEMGDETRRLSSKPLTLTLALSVSARNKCTSEGEE
jgi:hypothetical protein